MASRLEVEQARAALKRLADRAERDLLSLADLRVPERLALRKALAGAYPELVAEYAAASAALGADMAEMMAADLGVRPILATPPPVGPERALGALDWSIRQSDPESALLSLTDHMVRDPYRETIAATAERSGVRWARVPTGSETCAFCLMLASRGAIYKSADIASGRKYHRACDCIPVMSRSDDDLPEDYSPNELYGKYLDARAAAESGNTKAILSALREQEGIH